MIPNTFFYFINTKDTYFNNTFKPQFSHLFKQQFLNSITKRPLDRRKGTELVPSNSRPFSIFSLFFSHAKNKIFYYELV